MKWDTKRAVWLGSFEGHKGPVSSMKVNWNNRRVLTSSYDKTIKLWDIDEATCMQTLRGHEGPACCADPDWSTGRVVSGEEDVDARLWDMETGKTVMMLQGHTGPVWTASINVHAGTHWFWRQNPEDVGPEKRPVHQVHAEAHAAHWYFRSRLGDFTCHDRLQ